MIFVSTLMNRLIELRERKGWSKTQVARKLGIKTVSTYANWEYGLRQPDQEMIIKIAELYEVRTDYLLGVSDIPTNDKNDKEFQDFMNDPNLGLWFKELKDSPEDQVDELRKIWEIIKSREPGRKPGDKQK
jgi:transcriptional regulator with XRE-family HTH domain